MSHALITSLRSFTGNPRGCVYTEPLWGVPYNLVAPYASVYMVALGLTDRNIGLVLSVSWGFQVFWALMSGAITDKVGRRLTTLLFDILAWSVPAIIWALSQNFWWFMVAGIMNAIWRVTMNSWTCLLVEDAEHDQLVDIYTWIHISNLAAGFVAPLAGVLVARFDLVPAMRVLYFFAAIMFTLKAVLTYLMTEETTQGKVRMVETRDQSIFAVLGEYHGVVREIVRRPETLYTAGIMLIIAIVGLINGGFWGILVTEKLNVPPEVLSIFPFLKSAVALGFFFFVMPRLAHLDFKWPMFAGFLAFVAAQILLITAPEQGYLILGLSVFVEACAYAAVSPLLDKLIVLTIDAQERARVQSILYVGVILLTAPFGWIAGALSSLDKNLPFLLNIALLLAGAGLAWVAGRTAEKHKATLAVNVEM
ncbi:MAG TPA: MFS transporter [Chloroflexi bacterium]|nr:MFS transporter [Chloroflexota bacterium]